MTLSDLIRKYFEKRRRICEQKARYLDLSTDNAQYYCDHDPDETFLVPYNVHYFSNDLDPKTEKSKSGKVFRHGTPTKSFTTSSITITLPDGTKQKETIIRDGDGNEEKHITYKKDGKNIKRIIRKDPSGVERVEEIVSDTDRDNDYDSWFNKFFKPEEDDSGKESQAVFGNVLDVDKTIEEMMRIAGVFDGFGDDDKKYSRKTRDHNKEVFPPEFPNVNDSYFKDEARRFLHNFGSTDFDPKNREKNVQNIIKKFIAPSESPLLFEQFAENALIEIPEEKTPLDRFIEPDEERRNKLKPMWQETGDLIKKLDQYFSEKRELGPATDVYSDIENPEEVDITFAMPFSEPKVNVVEHPNDLIDIFKKAFGPNLNAGNMQTTIIDNGKKRVESVRKSANGETEKTISYQIGNKSYTLTIVVDKTGKQIKREKSLNFPEDELPQFKNQWNKTFHSDFSD